MEPRRKGVYGWFGMTVPTFDPENRFVASPFLSPLTLGIIRLVFAAYMTACIITEPILLKKGRRTRRNAKKFPAYFTNITFISLAWYTLPSQPNPSRLHDADRSSYFWVSGIYSIIYAITGRSPLAKYPKFLQLLHSLFYSTITTFPFVVTAVFWSLISMPPHKKAFSTANLQWSNISFHCLNSVFALFEVLFSAVRPQRWTHSLVIAGILGLYIAMAYLIRLTAKFYVYEFMDPSMMGALTAAYIFGIGGLGTVTFVVVQVVVWVKGFVGGKGVWRSKYDLPRWGIPSRMEDGSQGIEVPEKYSAVTHETSW